MQTNKDLGNQIKNIFEGAEKSPDNSLWEKVNETLDKKADKRKRFLYFKLLAGIFLLGVLALLLLPEKNIFKTDDENLNHIENLKSEEGKNDSRQNLTNKDVLTNLEVNNLIKNYKDSLNNLKVVNIVTVAESATYNLDKNNSQTVSIKKKKPNSLDDFNVKSTYYYYNSETNKHLQTHDKAVIDSLVKDSAKLKDSIFM